MVGRKGPRADTVLRAGDEVVAVTRTENEDALRAVLTASAGYGPYGRPADTSRQ